MAVSTQNRYDLDHFQERSTNGILSDVWNAWYNGIYRCNDATAVDFLGCFVIMNHKTRSDNPRCPNVFFISISANRDIKKYISAVQSDGTVTETTRFLTITIRSKTARKISGNMDRKC